MSTLFTRIIDGDVPGIFVWKDEFCVAFMTIAPLRPGHVLVVPRAEVDHWLDLDAETVTHVMEVAQVIGKAQMKAFDPTRVGVIIAGMEVPHTHVHVIPIETEADLSFSRATPATPEQLEAAAAKIRTELTASGRSEVSD